MCARDLCRIHAFCCVCACRRPFTHGIHHLLWFQPFLSEHQKPNTCLNRILRSVSSVTSLWWYVRINYWTDILSMIAVHFYVSYNHTGHAHVQHHLIGADSDFGRQPLSDSPVCHSSLFTFAACIAKLSNQKLPVQSITSIAFFSHDSFAACWGRKERQNAHAHAKLDPWGKTHADWDCAAALAQRLCFSTIGRSIMCGYYEIDSIYITCTHRPFTSAQGAPSDSKWAAIVKQLQERANSRYMRNVVQVKVSLR